MPLKQFITINDEKPLPQIFKEYIEYIYGGSAFIDRADEYDANISMNVPGNLKREEFEDDVKEFCDEYGCKYELVNLAPEAPSPQFFSENMRLMYPSVKDFETLSKKPRNLEKAIALFKESWNEEPDMTSSDDQEELVLLFNEYQEELRKWKPVEVKLIMKEHDEEEEDESEEVEDAAPSEDLLDPNNPKYEGFESYSITNAEEIDPGKEVIEHDTGEKRRISIIKYIPYGALKKGDVHYLYGVVSNYDGSDCPDIGAIVSVSLEGAKEDLDHQIQLAEQGYERYLGKGKWDKEWFEMLKDPEFDFSEEDKKHYSEKYGWDFSKTWEEQEFIKNAK